MNHVVLLGDSILDNAAYVADGPPIITQVQERLPIGWKATLLAFDGSITTHVIRQLDHLPADTTRVVVSIGGNNALMHSSVLRERVQSAAEVFQRIAEIGGLFEQGYHEMLQAVLAHQIPTTLCTIYYPWFADPAIQQLTVAGLLVFNDSILRAGFSAGLPVIDLRLVCTSAADYANEIEPSVAGGAKIVDAIVEVVTQHDFTQRHSTIYV
jgi:GDSL-like Lipase/Acylhydrolase family